MSKNVKTLFISIAVLVILGGAIFMLRATDSRQSGEGGASEATDGSADTAGTASQGISEPEKPSVVFTDLNPERSGSVLSIKVSNGRDDGYTIAPNPLTDDDNFLIRELEERSDSVPYNQELLATAVTAVKQLSAKTTVEENAEDLSKYGLLDSDVTASVEVEYADKDAAFDGKIAFLVGDPTPDESDNTYYVRLKGGNTVYTMSTYTVNPFFLERHEWLEKTAFPRYNTAEATTVDIVKIERADLDEPIVIEAIPVLSLEETRTFNQHRLVSPPALDADAEKANFVIYGLFGLTASHVLWVAPDEFDYEFNGLDEPSCTVTVINGENEYTLILGNGYDNDFYGEGVCGISSHAPDLLFLFKPTDLPWLTVNPEDLISDIFLTPFIYSLDKLVIETEADNYEFTITGDEEKNSVTYNGETVSGGSRERFLSLYQFLISARGENLFTDDNTERETVAKIKYVYRDKSRGEDIVEFRKGDNRKSVIRVNGKNLFTCRDIYAERLLQNLKAFVENKEIILDW